MAGWIKISREIANHWLWQDAERLKWWLDLLFLAAYEDKRQLVGKQLILLRKGQLIASLSYLCKRWGRSRTMVEPWLNLLMYDGMIE
ncbi:MAG: DNA replication protein DnaD, partial [Bacteroidaceae bacterium]|nr:DNA replication protein DnaD [Bacteroidaceae bacterium]